MSPSVNVLSNGLNVILAPCEAESVAVGVFVASGSRHETDDVAGISHFIEHMLFKGTEKRSALDITRAIEGRGGNFNACTGEETTCYYVHLPSDFLGEAVDILSDMYLHAAIDAEEFAREKSVVIEEIKMYADEPDSVAQENLQRALFPEHPLGRPVAGSAATLSPLKPADLKRYIRSHYRADNTHVVIVGSFDPDVALKTVSKAFASLRKPSSTLPPATCPLPPATCNLSPTTCHLSPATCPLSPATCPLPPAPCPLSPVVASVSVDKDVQQTQLALGYRTFGIDDPRKYAATVMDAILGRGMSSRLFQEVREKRGLSYDICSRMQFFQDAGQFCVFAGVPSDKAEKALATIDRELKRICTTRVPKAELERIKEFLIGNFRLSHENVKAKLFFYGHTFLAFNRLVLTSEQIEGIRAVTAADVQSVAQAVFRPELRSVSWVTPKAKPPQNMV